MAKTFLKAIVAHCDRILRTADIKDYERAANGLQVENRGTVTRIAAAVDASLATVKLAVRANADLLIVHHGLFWGASHPWTGKRYELMQLLLEHDLAIYSSHLPLDAHPKLGNNAQLCVALGLKKLRPFFFDHGQHLGFQSEERLSRAELALRVQRATGAKPLIIPDEGIDTFVTGEGPHWTYAMAEELGVNVLYGGHYATETFGPKALAAHLSQKFKLAWTFLDHPTGL